MRRQLAGFLVAAKRQTYAGLDGAVQPATPLLFGSKQLEFEQGVWRYRDIYFGSASFSGMETVSENDRIVWAMSYAGGIAREGLDRQETSIYRFLREALLLVEPNRPMRGPEVLERGRLCYRCDVEGALDRFKGRELVVEDGRLLYELHFSGGLIR